LLQFASKKHRNLHRNFFYTIEQLELENKARAFFEQAQATRVLGTALPIGPTAIKFVTMTAP